MDCVVLGLIIVILLSIDTSASQFFFHYFWQNFDFAGLIKSLEPIFDIVHDFVGNRRVFSPNNGLDIKCIEPSFSIDFPSKFREFAPAIIRIAMLPVAKTWPLDVLPVIVDVFKGLPRLKVLILQRVLSIGFCLESFDGRMKFNLFSLRLSAHCRNQSRLSFLNLTLFHFIHYQFLKIVLTLNVAIFYLLNKPFDNLFREPKHLKSVRHLSLLPLGLLLCFIYFLHRSLAFLIIILFQFKFLKRIKP